MQREMEREKVQIVNLDLWKMDWKEESWSIKKKKKKENGEKEWKEKRTESI